MSRRTRWLRALVVLVVLGATAVACNTGADEPVPEGVTTTRRPPPPPPSVEEVQDVEDCDDLIEVGELYVRNMVQALESGLPLDVLTGDGPEPPELALLREVGRELDSRVARLDCVVGDLNQAIAAEVADIESDEPVVAIFLDIVRSGVVDPIPAPGS